MKKIFQPERVEGMTDILILNLIVIALLALVINDSALVLRIILPMLVIENIVLNAYKQIQNTQKKDKSLD